MHTCSRRGEISPGRSDPPLVCAQDSENKPLTAELPVGFFHLQNSLRLTNILINENYRAAVRPPPDGLSETPQDGLREDLRASEWALSASHFAHLRLRDVQALARRKWLFLCTVSHSCEFCAVFCFVKPSPPRGGGVTRRKSRHFLPTGRQPDAHSSLRTSGLHHRSEVKIGPKQFRTGTQSNSNE